METIDPDKLLAKPASVKLGKGIVLSALIHLALIALTSIGLYKAWAKWGLVSEKGFNTPNVIKQLEKDAAKSAADAAQAASEEAAEKSEAPAAAAESPRPAEKPSESAAPAPAAEPAQKADAAPQQTPLDKQVSKPPKSFDLDDIDL